VKTYHGPEFRVSGRYNLSNQSSIKFGFNTMRQNIHLLSKHLGDCTDGLMET